MTSRDQIGRHGSGECEARPTLLVFSDDWGRHPSSCQHLIRQLLPRYHVAWVNTIGTRLPRLDRLTLKRGLGKLAEWTSWRGSRSPQAVDRSEPTVWSPLMWPRFASAGERRFNAHRLQQVIQRALPDDRTSIGLTTIPLVADLIGRPPVERWVYYCVDDLSEWPGLDRQTLLGMERKLVDRVDEIVVVSHALERRIEAMGRASTLLTHGVDLEHWQAAAGPPLPQLAAYRRPLVVFWGVVDRRLEFDWLKALAARLEGGSVLLVGPTNNPDPALHSLDGVALEPPISFDQLPRLAASAAVLIMPYGDQPATRAMQPLKLKEYLATDRPVVVSALPAVEGWRDACDVAGDAGQFVELVMRRLESGLLDDQARARQRLEEETWPLKARAFERLLLGRPLQA